MISEKQNLKVGWLSSVREIALTTTAEIDSNRAAIDSKATDIDSGKTEIESHLTDIDSKATDIDSGKTEIESQPLEIRSVYAEIDSALGFIRPEASDQISLTVDRVSIGFLMVGHAMYNQFTLTSPVLLLPKLGEEGA